MRPVEVEKAQRQQLGSLGRNVAFRQSGAPFGKLSRERLHVAQCSPIARRACSTTSRGVR